MNLINYLKSKLFLKHALLASLFSGILLWSSVKLLGFYTEHGDYVKVPDFKGIMIGDLDEFIDGQPIEYSIADSVFIIDKPKGIVLEQDQAPGWEVKRGRTVYLTVNAILNQQVPMPNLINLSDRHATSLLESYGLKVGNRYYVQGLPPVIEQKFKGAPIKPGTLVDKGSFIDLVLGKSSTESTLVPSLIGLNLDEAKEIAIENGIFLSYTYNSLSANDSLDFIIADQLPEPGNSYQGQEKTIKLRFVGQDGF